LPLEENWPGGCEEQAAAEWRLEVVHGERDGARFLGMLSGREKKSHGRQGGAVRAEKRLSSVQQISEGTRIQYMSWGNWDGEGTAAKCPLRAGGLGAGVSCLAWADQTFQGRGGSTAGVTATQESNGQQTARTGAVLLAVDSKRGSTAQDRKEWLQESAACDQQGPGESQLMKVVVPRA
jgi:hypothetical protein